MPQRFFVGVGRHEVMHVNGVLILAEHAAKYLMFDPQCLVRGLSKRVQENDVRRRAEVVAFEPAVRQQEQC